MNKCTGCLLPARFECSDCKQPFCGDAVCHIGDSLTEYYNSLSDRDQRDLENYSRMDAQKLLKQDSHILEKPFFWYAQAKNRYNIDIIKVWSNDDEISDILTPECQTWHRRKGLAGYLPGCT